MSLKARLQRLEDSQKAKADAISSVVTAEQSRQTIEWINATVKHITEGTPMPPPLPRDMSRSPAQEKANANARAWIDEILKKAEHTDELKNTTS